MFIFGIMSVFTLKVYLLLHDEAAELCPTLLDAVRVSSSLHTYIILLACKVTYSTVFTPGPPVIDRADNVDIVHGQSAILNCEALANPPARIGWFSNNKTFGENSTSDDRPTVLSNGSLYIRQPDPNDAGNYTCVAINEIGQDKQIVVLRIGGRS